MMITVIQAQNMRESLRKQLHFVIIKELSGAFIKAFEDAVRLTK